ncbi:uncharacterized protein [Triticum aestivum]|uniref:uncharacterized protein n=1 Tax=Triticum aestivum TaxID=4565 RepID=UPI001D032B25|nr:uncharacterized protein LOC123138779 [Triticum aestivum]
MCNGGAHISDLSDDLFLHILSLLPTGRDLARTSALSRRWRDLWRDLWMRGRVLRFDKVGCSTADPDADVRYNDLVHDVLARRANSGASVDTLKVSSWLWPGDARAQVWLHLAMELAVGSLAFHLRTPERERMPGKTMDELRPWLTLPCSTSATSMSLELDNAFLLLPPTVEFHALTDLTLCTIRFTEVNGGRLSSLLSSSSCCPRLQKLTLKKLAWLPELQLNGSALEILHLEDLSVRGLLDVNASQLSALHVDGYFMDCYTMPPNSVTIRAPALQTLDLSLNINYCQLERQRHAIQLLQECSPIHRHVLSIHVPEKLKKSVAEDQLEEMPKLPSITNLTLKYYSKNSHSFEASVTTLLARCSNLRHLRLDNFIHKNIDYASKVTNCISRFELNGSPPKYGTPCDVGCSTCDLRGSWKDNVISLDHLQEVEFSGFSGQEYCLDMVQLLFTSAPTLEKMLLTTHVSTDGCSHPPTIAMEPLELRLPRGMGKWTAHPSANMTTLEWTPASSTMLAGAVDA